MLFSFRMRKGGQYCAVDGVKLTKAGNDGSAELLLREWVQETRLLFGDIVGEHKPFWLGQQKAGGNIGDEPPCCRFGWERGATGSSEECPEAANWYGRKNYLG